MSVVIYNTKTKTKEPFQPLVSPQVTMYVCGVTVYDDCHLGHARSALVFDTIRRYLEFRGYQVKYVRNFTDVDDKIINRAEQDGIPWTEVTETYIKAFYRDMGRLGIIAPNVEPRATEHIGDIVDMIAGLVDKGFAYEVDGDVYFEVQKFSDYGKLSGKNLEELLAGARIEVDPRKKDPMDFALWKASKPGEPGWESPWGQGRPGWHIECSAMSVKHLGATFDIHGGGKDLIFPHHENEVAQSCASTGQEFARYWIHNGFVTIDQEKMSKSLGNFFTIKEIFEKSPCKDEEGTGEALRYYLLSTHYRSDLNFSDQSISEAKMALDNFYDLFGRLEESENQTSSAGDKEPGELFDDFRENFTAAMDDDFNTPKALATFHELRGELNKLMVKGLSKEASERAVAELKEYGQPLGLFQVPVKEWKFGANIRLAGDAPFSFYPRATLTVISDEDIEQKIQLRKEAREKKDFAAADRIRKELADQGIILEDRPDGTTRWKR